MPMDSTTIIIANAIRPNTPFVPAFGRKNPIIKLANTVLSRLNE